MNRAIDHVIAHLAQPLSLDEVAAAALVSPFHFHRIFRALTGETLNAFITRLRLEKALTLMAHHRHRTLTEVALASGFSSPSDFARCFRQRFGVAPSRYDLAAHRERQRVALKDTVRDRQHRRLLDRLPPGANPDGFEVTRRDLPARTVAYIRVPDSFRDGAVVDAAQRLVAWAQPRGLADRRYRPGDARA